MNSVRSGVLSVLLVIKPPEPKWESRWSRPLYTVCPRLLGYPYRHHPWWPLGLSCCGNANSGPASLCMWVLGPALRALCVCRALVSGRAWSEAPAVSTCAGCKRTPASGHVGLSPREGEAAPTQTRVFSSPGPMPQPPVSSTRVCVIKPHGCAGNVGQAAGPGRLPPSETPKLG